ncbi:MAG: protease inhibitor family protein [Actinomycetota bacterium]|nr:protease inhibitor family protein [Actinomycetota bacterium]
MTIFGTRPTVTRLLLVTAFLGTALGMVALPATGAEPSGTPANAPVPAAPCVSVRGPDGLPTEAIRLRLGTCLEVHLREAAGSTGYAWSVRSVTGGLTFVGDVLIPPTGPSPTDPAPPGAPGDHIFTFRAVRPGSGSASFDLRRSWEPEPGQTVTVTAIIRPRL